MTGHTLHIDRFIEQLGRLAEGENLPRTAGRMMGLLLLSGSALSLDDMATRLKVSRASVSTNSRLLQTLAIAQLVTRPGDRRDYLQISGDPCSSLLVLGLQRMQAMRAAMEEMRLGMEGSRFGATRSRLKRIESFYDDAIGQIRDLLEGWREKQAKRLSRASR